MARFSMRWKESDDDDTDIDKIEGYKNQYDIMIEQQYREENKENCGGITDTTRAGFTITFT